MSLTLRCHAPAAYHYDAAINYHFAITGIAVRQHDAHAYLNFVKSSSRPFKWSGRNTFDLMHATRILIAADAQAFTI